MCWQQLEGRLLTGRYASGNQAHQARNDFAKGACMVDDCALVRVRDTTARATRRTYLPNRARVARESQIRRSLCEEKKPRCNYGVLPL